MFETAPPETIPKGQWKDPLTAAVTNSFRLPSAVIVVALALVALVMVAVLLIVILALRRPRGPAVPIVPSAPALSSTGGSPFFAEAGASVAGPLSPR